jgi:SpoVK/Ycf46/Vps4 family AAA+-type ATPase
LPLPLIRLTAQALPALARRALWQSLLPQLGDQAGLLAARYPIDPETARAVVRDLALRQHLDAKPVAVEQVGDCIRARTNWQARPGMRRILPRAEWSDLLVPDAAGAQLRSAVQRVLQQITVLDDWGFAQGRDERRGVRLLFFGPPGTGKTLAAEVMANALGVDMLIIDLAALVSKWIGETEKNLAAVFEVAERSRALLLFDEADALFAKRTENQDAHDRYANLETAYLLQRLERYEGVAILTTNLRSNIDKAFTRRFEHIVEFPEPDTAAREALWRLHLPAAAPLAADVSLAELATWYPISGAQIKNAALSAAFGAAAAGTEIHQQHFLVAIEREYDKAGRAHPGSPQQTSWPAAGQAVGSEAFPPTH